MVFECTEKINWREMRVHHLTPFPWETPGTSGVGICSSTHGLGDIGLWPPSMSLAYGLSLRPLLSPRAAPGSCQCSACGELPSLLPGMRPSIPPGLLAYTSLSGGRCKRLAVFLRSLYVTFSARFILLQSSSALWGTGIFIQQVWTNILCCTWSEACLQAEALLELWQWEGSCLPTLTRVLVISPCFNIFFNVG